MIPWETLATAEAPDGTALELRRRGHEYRIRAGGHELMSNDDERSSRALADIGCAHLAPSADARVLVGGLGMGFTLRAALDRVGPGATVEVAELVEAVAEWNRGPLAGLAGAPLEDRRTVLRLQDVRCCMRAAPNRYDAILLDVDNGPKALAHAGNDALYGRRGLAEAWRALCPGGVLAVWSLLDDRPFTKRLERQGFAVKAHRVPGSRKGRGRYHVVWAARRPPEPAR
ncbi:MAG: spermidine synthase [Myxococcota bacterium]